MGQIETRNGEETTNGESQVSCIACGSPEMRTVDSWFVCSVCGQKELIC